MVTTRQIEVSLAKDCELGKLLLRTNRLYSLQPGHFFESRVHEAKLSAKTISILCAENCFEHLL